MANRLSFTGVQCFMLMQLTLSFSSSSTSKNIEKAAAKMKKAARKDRRRIFGVKNIRWSEDDESGGARKPCRLPRLI